MNPNPEVSDAAHAQAFANALAQLAKGAAPAGYPGLIVVLMNDSRRRAVLLYDPAHDGLRFIRGGCIADETEHAAAARLLEEYVGIRLPPVSFRRVLSVPPSNHRPTHVQVYGATMPPELLTTQMRSSQVAEQIVHHSAAIQILGDNPVCLTSINPLRHQRVVIVPRSVPPRYAIPYGVPIPQLILNQHLDAPGVMVVPGVGDFRLMQIRSPWIETFEAQFVRVSTSPRILTHERLNLPTEFRRQVPRLEVQDGGDESSLRRWLDALPSRMALVGVEPETHDAMFAMSTLFKGNLLSRWQTKLMQAPDERRLSAGFSRLSALSKAIPDAFFTRDRKGMPTMPSSVSVRDRRVSSTITRK